MAQGVLEIIGIYDADSTLVGEVSYWVKARFGRAHCSLCDLTHGVFRVKSEWVECSRTLSVPVVTYHRNDAPTDALDVVTEFPVVLARTMSGIEVLAERSDLEIFDGDTEAFAQWLRAFVESSDVV